MGASDDYQRLIGGLNLIINDTCYNTAVTAGTTSENSNVGIRIQGDTNVEFHETVIATLSLVNPPAGVVLGTSVATYIIQDDDSTDGPPVPPTPTGFTATAGDGEVTLSWNAFSLPFTRLEYRQKAGSGSYGSWMTIIGGATGTTSHTVTGLINGTTYTFQLQAVTINAHSSVAGVASDVQATPTDVDPNAPKLVSIKRHAQEVRNLGTSLVWRVSVRQASPGSVEPRTSRSPAPPPGWMCAMI